MKTNLTPEQLEKRTRINKKILLYGLPPIVVLFTILMFLPGDESHEKQKAEKVEAVNNDFTSEAFIVSQKFVKTQLNYPAESDFDFLPKLTEKKSDSVYNVVGGLTAKNAFGVKSEIQYFATLQYLGGDPLKTESWKVIEITY